MKPLRLAVLMDGDNINSANFGPILAWASDKGEVVIRRIYGNHKTLSDWRECIDNHRIEPVSNVSISLFEATFGRFGHNPRYQYMYVKTD